MFYDVLKELDLDILNRAVTKKEVEHTLQKELLTIDDLAILLSTVASENLEEMARRAHVESNNNFGKTIQLYTPLYLGNYCENQCVYCAFNHTYKVARKKLNYKQVEAECEWIKDTGLDDILLLTGESRKHTGVDYICECSKVASKYFNSIGIEIYPLETFEYSRLIEAGVTGLTIYQETYNEKKYDELHIAGPKKNFRYRLDTPERGAEAGMHMINIGALLGLSNPIEDAYKMGVHLDYLMNRYPEVEWGISLPRLRSIENGSFEGQIVPDTLFVKILLAFRLVFPKISISISTREDGDFRENLIPLGITKLSAGVCTSVGRLNNNQATNQFEISDCSSVDTVKEMVKGKGYQVIFKNWVKQR